MSIERLQKLNPNIIAICGGILTAGFALFPLNLSLVSFLVTYFAAIPLFFVGLCWGFSQLIVSCIVAFGIFSLGSGLHSGLVFGLTTLVPSLLMVYRFFKGDPAGYLVSWLAGLAIVLFLGILLALSSQNMNVLDIMHSWFTFFADEQAFKSLHSNVIQLLPAISSISWIMMCLVNASIAQRFAVKNELALRPYPLPKDTQVYEYWDLILVLSLMLILTEAPLFAFIGKNIAIISCIPIFFVGLKVVYAWLNQFDNPKLWMVTIVFMSIFLVWPGIVIVMFGVLEPTLRLCQRWTGKKS
ncbi:MAG: hypothetical protein FJX03_02545 [Alphaproteobacteria bacterium]|nr:hypothetical protein [Alphaproteobacteria bacterium]